MKITDQISELLKSALQALEINLPGTIEFEHPANPEHGDWSTNLALVLFKQQSRYSSPRALAEALAEQLSQINKQIFKKTAVAGPGFINFYLSDAFLTAEMALLIKHRGELNNKQHTGEKAVVEFSSPNIAKPFTIGHFRSTIIGWAIANLLEETGYTVFRDNHLGDWGTQFGKQIYALWHLGAGSLEKNIAIVSSSDNPVKELVNLYVEFHRVAATQPELEDQARAIFKKLEDGDQEMRQLWQKCIDWSFVEFDRIYQKLGVTFTENAGRGYGESYFENQMADVIAELEEKANQTGQINYQTGENGAKIVTFAETTKLPPLMILKSDGATLYATRDLATDKWRLQEKYGPETLIVNEVGAEQSQYFQQLFAIELALNWVKPGQRVHVGHGMYRFKEGKMSTRQGNVIWLDDVLNEATARAAVLASDKQVLTEAEIEQVAFGALKWADLKKNARLDLAFDWEDIMTMQGNAGPYLQYSYVRCKSIMEKAQNSDSAKYFDTLLNIKSPLTLVTSRELSPGELDLLRHLSSYYEVVNQAATEYAPHYLATYLFALAQSFNQFYVNNQVLSGVEEITKFRLALVLATSYVIARGLKILGIEVVEKM